MIRRSFRIGLALGLLGGLAFALVKMFGARSEPAPRAAPVPTQPWPRLQADPTRPAPATAALVPDPDAPTPRADAAPPAAPEPVVPAPAPAAAPTKAAATKAAPAKTAPTKAAAKKAPKKKPLVAPWVEPSGDVCPTSHPVKGKLGSRIFHLPGMLNYERTRPDRCYRDVPAAEADGLRPAKR